VTDWLAEIAVFWDARPMLQTPSCLGHDREMDDRRKLARLALSLVEGSENADAHADALLADAFATHETAALAHAYLSGFILQVLATERSESVEQAASHVRRLLTDR
jgi:hypothetical protein